MINKPDFDRAAKDNPIAATVHYFDRDEPVTYATRDFGRIRFPVRRVTLSYESGTRGYVTVENDDYVKRDRKKVRHGK